MTVQRSRISRSILAGALATLVLSGCGIFQGALGSGEREFTYEDATEMEDSSEAFRFQGFVPAGATDVRLLADLDGEDAVMRWDSPTELTADHADPCADAQITTEPVLQPEWLPESLPTEGVECGTWAIVRSGDTQVAWNQTTPE